MPTQQEFLRDAAASSDLTQKKLALRTPHKSHYNFTIVRIFYD